jgi:hypothetical protein
MLYHSISSRLLTSVLAQFSPPSLYVTCFIVKVLVFRSWLCKTARSPSLSAMRCPLCTATSRTIFDSIQHLSQRHIFEPTLNPGRQPNTLSLTQTHHSTYLNSRSSTSTSSTRNEAPYLFESSLWYTSHLIRQLLSSHRCPLQHRGPDLSCGRHKLPIRLICR